MHKEIVNKNVFKFLRHCTEGGTVLVMGPFFYFFLCFYFAARKRIGPFQMWDQFGSLSFRQEGIKPISGAWGLGRGFQENNWSQPSGKLLMLVIWGIKFSEPRVPT